MKEKPSSEFIDENLMVMQGYTHAFFIWVLKDREDDYIYKAFVELLQEFRYGRLSQQLFFVILNRGLINKTVDVADIERLCNAVLKNDTPLYQWMVIQMDNIKWQL
jgi:hypothetical protein